MSIKAMTWAFDQPLSGNEKVVLLALADFADDDGLCWPSISRIAEKAYLSERTVQRIILSLSDQEYLRFERRNTETGRSNSNSYRLIFEGDSLTPSRVTLMTPMGDTADTHEGDTVVTPYEPSIRTINEPKNIKRGSRVPENFRPDKTSEEVAGSHGVAITADLIDGFLDYWRDVPGAKGLKLDWQGTFRNHIRHVSKLKSHAKPSKPNSIVDSFRGVDAQIERMERELAALESSAA